MTKFLLSLAVSLFSCILLANNLRQSTPAVDYGGYDCANNNQISIVQCQTLVDIYQQTNGLNWLNSNSNNWLQSNQPCSWEGVACRGNKVIRLELPANGLRGTLPDISGLAHLQQLGLFENPDLTGPLPDLTQLPDLNKVTLFKTGLSGFLPDVANMPQLTHLQVHHSNFIGPIPAVSHLEEFYDHGNHLCLSPRIDYSSVNSNAANYPVCQPMLSNQLKGELNVTDFGAIPDDNKNDHQAINHALNMLQLTLPEQRLLTNVTVYFPAGTYDVEKSITLRNFNALKILGVKSDTSATILKKGEGFGNSKNKSIKKSQQGAIFDLRFGYGLTMKYLKLIGQLTDTSTPYLWWDHGVYIGSSHHTKISENEFQHFGDSALTIATDIEDTSTGINSLNHLVYRNYFYNITQTSTTSEHGGSTQYSFIGNTAEHVKGAIKFSTRKAGAKFLNIVNNHIVSAGVENDISTNNGIEIEGYSHVNVSDNTLSHGKGVGIVIRSIPSASEQSAYDWGNITVLGNKISNYRQAIYISNLPHGGNGSLAQASNISVSNNTINNMWNRSAQATIHFVGSQFKQCRVTNNSIIGIGYDIWPSPGERDWLHIEGNRLN